MSVGASFLDQVNRAFDRAAAFTHHHPTLLANIKACKNLFYTSFPIKRDDGTIEVMHAWRAEHSHHKLPCKGGIRYALSGGRRRGAGAGRAHDLQVRAGGRAVRRRQGRHPDRSQDLLGGRAGADHPALRVRAGAQELHGPRPRRAGARRGHRHARDGLDRRHLHPAPPGRARRARLRHRQAGERRRHPRPDRGHRPRGVLRHPRGLRRRRGHEGARALARARGQAGGDPGAGQRGLLRRQVLPARAGAILVGPGRSRRARSPTRRGSTSRRSWRTGGSAGSAARLPRRDQPRRAGRTRSSSTATS